VEVTDSSPAQPVYSFGTFRLFPRTGVLQDHGRDVRLGSRAMGLLTALVERGGEVAVSDELLARVWPTTTVDEQNLRVQIAGLRKTLADGHGDERFIATVAGRGYRFVAPVTAETLAESHEGNRAASRGNLPAALSRLFGRGEVIDDLSRRLAEERLVTVVGPGGVGKTSVAIAVAHKVAGGSAWFADLAPVSDPELVATALLETFGLAAMPQNLLPALARRLDGQNVLLVLDNCEHLAEACAAIAEALLGAIKGLRVLATSREILRAAGERVIRLPALETPGSDTSLVSASNYSAVQLFVHRAASSEDRFSLTADTLSPVIDICRRLDGMPLALELAAAAVSILGVRGVAERLREHLELPGRGRRTAAARQASLRATLEWSYRLLSRTEQRALRRLAVFQGAFSLESAAAVAGPSDTGEASILELLAELAEKSLLTVDLSHEEARYRFLQTTRTFALAQLALREAAATRARHARELQRLAEATERAWGAGDSEQARRDSAELIDDLSAAIEWALSPVGDFNTAVDLIITASPLRRRLSLLREHRKQVERALDQVRAFSPPNPSAEMRLLGSYGLASAFRYATRDWIVASAERLQALAQELGDGEHLMRGLWDRATAAALLADGVVFRQCTDRFLAAAMQEPTDTFRAMAHFLRSFVAMRDGDITLARRETEAGLELLAHASGDLAIAQLGWDPRLSLYEGLVTILWAQGFPDQALAAGRACVEHCRRLSHTQSLMHALTNIAAYAALLMGDAETAAAFLDEHQRYCEERGERGYGVRAQEFSQAVLRIERTGLADGAAAALVAPGSTNPLLPGKPELCARLAEAIGRSRSPDEGLAAVETLSALWGPGDWVEPELLRVRASLLWKTRSPVTEVEALLRGALSRAAKMGALTTELRIVTTLADLLSEGGRASEALAMLTDVLDRVSEGHSAADYQRAVTLKESLRSDANVRGVPVGRRPAR
jgi:predicted ATPase/DNA-binding winged helix-turn-helix (wHTH) protein